MKYKVSERISVSRARNGIVYPYTITITSDNGFSQSIWLDEEQFETLIYKMQYVKSASSGGDYGAVIISIREYERPS